ncbi:hypothetical protein [Kocuria rosea]|uniref:Uncharacterized protein n=1 Tax=Kocuria rosea subsp. polaris TaxID=136273 RepID=A0A0A6YA86_KOCRO|nr:hypothetical protein [Kocuria polaris]KHD96252.1 hypothetical protein GY22_16605 [Kocuria polaris]
MGLEVLVPLLMGALIQVTGRAGEGVLGAVEDATKDTASTVFGKIKAWWSGDDSASGDLEKFVSEPDIYQPVIEARLVRKLADEPAMQDELAKLLADAGPQAEVYQSISKAHGITGAKVQDMLRGRLQVQQDIENASDVTGADINRMG